MSQTFIVYELCSLWYSVITTENGLGRSDNIKEEFGPVKVPYEPGQRALVPEMEILSYLRGGMLHSQLFISGKA